MSLLARLKLPANKRLFALQQLNFYSAKSADVPQEAVKSTRTRTQKSSESSPSASHRTKKGWGPQPATWPKPKEIPYQAKVANFVNLVGYVEAPVRSETGSDGKQLAAIVISQESTDRYGSMSIPVVFDGDLAHVVAYHVKQNDCVLVSGRLSVDPVKFSLGGGFGKFHVVAENLNFVEGFMRNAPPKKVEVSFAGTDIEEPDPGQIELSQKVDNIQQLEQATNQNDCASGGSVEYKLQQGHGKSGTSAYRKKDEELWTDLAKNPLQWWDFRDHKSNGLVKDKHPDFKHKWSGNGLWMDSAPEWILTEIGKLEFDIKAMQGKQVQGREGIGGKIGSSKGEDLWKNLMENPSMWWDNRLDKRNPRAPDFKHKETREGVWLNQLPDWALSKLPPCKDAQNAVDGEANTQAS